MSKPVPRSRLNITYRTKIDGVVAKKRLPLRVLVLGDFSGGSKIPYEKRNILSINPGTPVSSFMNELALACPIDDKELQSVVPAQLKARITGMVKKSSEADGTVLIRFTGEGSVEAEARVNGLCSVQGTVALSGQCSAVRKQGKLTMSDSVELHIRGEVDGDITGSVDLKHNHSFDTKLFDEDQIAFTITAMVPVQLTIPIRNMNCFTPQHVAVSVPEIHRLVVLRRLLGEIRNHIAARPDLREGVKATLRDGELEQLHAWMKENFPLLQLPQDALDLAKKRSLALAA